MTHLFSHFARRALYFDSFPFSDLDVNCRLSGAATHYRS